MPAVSDPLRARDEAAVRGYRGTGDRRHLDVLRMDGMPGMAHDLTVERYGGNVEATARIDAWLGDAAPNGAPESPPDARS